MNKAFETQLGRLQVTLLEEPAGDKRSGEGEKVDPSEPAQFPNAVKVVFESYKDGKLFQRDIDTQSVASLHPLFQFDPSLINDIMQGHPDDIQLERRKLQRVEKIMKKTARQERARLAQTRSKSVVAIPHLRLLAT